MSLHSEIHVGYEIGTGRAVSIPLRHLAVTGQTQESGKTTTLEGLISRSGLRAIAYVTKRGESSFHVANPIQPYFQERADWQFVQSLLEAAMSTKMDFKQPWIMRVSDGAKTLDDVRANLRRFLDGVPAAPSARAKKKKSDDEPKKRWIQKPATGLSADVYYVLDKYFDDVMPQIQNLPYSTSLELAPGLNVMDLRDYDFAVQALVVRSVTDRIRQHEEKTVNIIPEAWKFAPKQRGSPVRLAAEEYVRESAAMKNYLWVDSQDLAGVADVIMRQVGVWIFGVQRAKHEIERALDHMPEGLPARRPRPADIATLGKGQFYVCFGREMFKVYVQPAWMTAAHAEAIARGEEDVDSAREILREYDKSSAAATKPAPLARAKTASASGAAAAGVDFANRGAAAQKAVDVATEDAVWKERYDELKREFDQLRESHDLMAKRMGSGGANGTEDPGIIKVNVDRPVLRTGIEKPEIEVRVKRREIEMDGSSVPGMIAILISEGFFDQPKPTVAVRDELRRRGLSFGNSTPLARLGEISNMGFLTREAKGTFRAVPGMKVNIVEA